MSSTIMDSTFPGMLASCHPKALKGKVLGLIQSQAFHLSSLQSATVSSKLSDSRDISTYGSWWEHTSGLGTPWSSCFSAVSSFCPACPIEPVSSLLPLLSQAERELP